MKKLFMFVVVLLSTHSAWAAAPFYECGGFAGVDEYRAVIDLNIMKAGFFDNDATSILALTNATLVEGDSSEVRYVFEGSEASFAGSLRLYFNLTRFNASIFSINSAGGMELIGTADCRATNEPWDLSQN